jgi:hypothetical protein
MRNKCAIRIVALFAAAALMATGAALPGSRASASPRHAPGAAHVGCTQSYDGAVELGESPNYGEVRWLTTGCGFYIRAKVLCAARFNGSVVRYSGIVRALRLWARATCTTSRPVIQYVKAQIKHSANGAWFTCETWPNFNC